MSVVKHAPDPLFVRETLCGEKCQQVLNMLHTIAAIGESINCPNCKVVINMATKCIAPRHYVLARMP